MTNVTDSMIKDVIDEATYMSGAYPTKVSQMEGVDLTQGQFEFLSALLNGYEVLWGNTEEEILNLFSWLDDELDETYRLWGTEPTCDFDIVSINNLQKEEQCFEEPLRYKSIYWYENYNGTVFVIAVLPSGELNYQVFVEQNLEKDHYEVTAVYEGRTLDQYYAWEEANDPTAGYFNGYVYQQQADFHNKHMVQHGFPPMVGWLQLVLERKLEKYNKIADAPVMAKALIEGDYTPLELAEELVTLLSDVLYIQEVYSHILVPEITGDEME